MSLYQYSSFAESFINRPRSRNDQIIFAKESYGNRAPFEESPVSIELLTALFIDGLGFQNDKVPF